MKQFHDAKGFNTRLPLLFQNYVSLTHETRMKDAGNMEDLTCLLATVFTLIALNLIEVLPQTIDSMITKDLNR